MTTDNRILEIRSNIFFEYGQIENILREIINEKKCFLQYELGMNDKFQDVNEQVVGTFNWFIQQCLKKFEKEKFIIRVRVKEFTEEFDNRFEGYNKQNNVIMLYNFDRIIKINKLLNENA